MRIHDISITLSSETVTWKNEEAAVTVEWVNRIGIDGSDNCTSRVSYGSHLGTHLDAPLHFVADGRTVESLDLTVLIGPCRVVEMPDIDHSGITADDFEAAGIPEGVERLLLKTSNSRNRLLEQYVFFDSFVAVAPSGARWLLDRGVKLVGVDYLSVGSAVDGTGGDTHRLLLGSGVIVVEGLALTDIAPGDYSLICLPLKIDGVEGGLVRAVLLEPDKLRTTE